ncbi:MAG: hypothetical protein D5R99_01595 [Methanocalculus sp. MSAO_Arc1]|nr:MAG: hypothetical protein D5R99_01595 [Methanocalculus sp. MSAO_Arc1]
MDQYLILLPLDPDIILDITKRSGSSQKKEAFAVEFLQVDRSISWYQDPPPRLPEKADLFHHTVLRAGACCKNSPADTINLDRLFRFRVMIPASRRRSSR